MHIRTDLRVNSWKQNFRPSSSCMSYIRTEIGQQSYSQPLALTTSPEQCTAHSHSPCTGSALGVFAHEEHETAAGRREAHTYIRTYTNVLSYNLLQFSDAQPTLLCSSAAQTSLVPRPQSTWTAWRQGPAEMGRVAHTGVVQWLPRASALYSAGWDSHDCWQCRSHWGWQCSTLSPTSSLRCREPRGIIAWAYAHVIPITSQSIYILQNMQ